MTQTQSGDEGTVKVHPEGCRNGTRKSLTQWTVTDVSVIRWCEGKLSPLGKHSHIRCKVVTQDTRSGTGWDWTA